MGSPRGPDEDARRFRQYEPDIVYRCVVGSRAYGLDGAGSDTDRRGIFLPRAERMWSLQGVPEQIERKETEECYWELAKFLRLAINGNPNVLECLYTPLVELATPIAQALLARRGLFLSKRVHATFGQYGVSQFRKMQDDLRLRGVVRWKHAMHLIRLLLSGIVILREGHVPVLVEAHREELLAIRRGEWSFARVDSWRQSLHRDLEQAFVTTRLPDEPDLAAVNAFLVEARRSVL